MKGTFTVGHRRRRPRRRRRIHRLPRRGTTRLVLTVTSQAVTLKTPAGKAVKALKAGRAAITVRDRSATRGVRLSGAGVSKSTGVTFVGTATWNVTAHEGHARLRERRAQAGAPRRPRARVLIRA